MIPGPVLNPALAISSISKSFGRGASNDKALDSLSLTVPQGCIFGLLGPNGAGKSTLLRIIAGLLRPDSGSIQIFGAKANVKTRQRLGMLIEAPSFYPFLTAREHIEMLSTISHGDNNADSVLHRVGLEDVADRKVSSFSLGMKQRLAIGSAIVGSPDVLILDEPTNGLDPDGILEMRSLIVELAKVHSTTVILSSHLLDEVQRVCERVAILKNGTLLAEGSVAELLERRARFWLSVEDPVLAARLLGKIALPGDGGLYVQSDYEATPRLIEFLVRANVKIYEAKWLKPSLESVFLDETKGGMQ